MSVTVDASALVYASNDRDFRRFDGIAVEDPFAGVGGPVWVRG
ncbi:MAG TPA: hypothetical protein VFT19_01300 [Solirubrobacterales bacterium]|nr:hypothetical protein [Solirubrobacterales bacterium]